MGCRMAAGVAKQSITSSDDGRLASAVQIDLREMVSLARHMLRITCGVQMKESLRW